MKTWPPYNSQILRQWLDDIVEQADSVPKPLMPAVQVFQDLTESDPVICMYLSSMFEETPREPPCDKDPLDRPQLRNYHHMLQVMNYVMTSAPKWNASDTVGWVGPFHVILKWPMSTSSGKAFFLNEKVNAALKSILCT